LSPKTFRSFADHTSTMVSPPRPLIIGSASASMPAMATAASAALPPCSSTRRPTRVTRGELELAIARPANTGERRCRKAGLATAATLWGASRSLVAMADEILRVAPAPSQAGSDGVHQ
jgi:hypothetical protein